MGILAIRADERVKHIHFTEETISVDLMDGRIITVPLIWYPRLFNAAPHQREKWEVCGGGYGIHWEEIDEDLSTEGMLRGAQAPRPKITH
ncbi:DUF2442 domain-containing protein [Tychonema sp. LEGE 07199]|uniref:DUF2442 domain-containing protein n=1 Tax=unclassified Tychonema TaxID=2642144 RepID=UPI00187FC3CE|nr:MULTISPECIES: DUF2442 domain-containing protein [unclassified Tychonema]MBE9121527.1 DUF2442 domain-containing protein [Tychonema sp. LEGE 07199]MBE9132336.1 DUF2442 domain-containing protein [Tychonema sp. LEGE 07196]